MLSRGVIAHPHSEGPDAGAALPRDSHYPLRMGVLLNIAYGVLLLLTSPIWGLSLLRTGKWRSDWRGRFGHEGQASHPVSHPARHPSGNDTVGDDGEPGDGEPGHDRPTVLLHAVSVGEVNAIRMLADELDAAGFRVVISVTTNSGTARAKQLFAERFAVVRFPFDFTWMVRRFLRRVQPDVVALVELEVWPTFTRVCRQRGIPVCVVNGRLSERSYRGYRRFRALLSPMFRRLTAVGAQTPAYAARFIGMGVAEASVQVTDSMKWDTARIEEPADVEGIEAFARRVGIDRERPLIVAGSTGPDEEAMLVRVIAEHCGDDVQLMLVPRKPERFEEVALAVNRAIGESPSLNPQGKVTRFSDCPADRELAPSGDRRLFLLDAMGELRKAYALADVCLVGRSFLGMYGSDVFEPIALGKPTVIGPHFGDFTDAVEAFRDGEAIVISDEPGRAAAALLADRENALAMASRGRDVILSRQGATGRTVELIQQVLRDAKP